MTRDYYSILGVRPDSSPEEIREAYLNRVAQLHSGASGNDEDGYRKVQEAYAVLGDNQRRCAYDRRIKEKPLQSDRPTVVEDVMRPSREPETITQTRPDPKTVSLTSSFETFKPSYDEIFDRILRNFQHVEGPKGDVSKNLSVEIPLTRRQAYEGGRIQILVPAQADCPACGGCGAIGPYMCVRCSGEGSISGEFPVFVSIPPRLTADHSVIIPLEGFGIRNLYLTVNFRLSDRR